jgi:hypothetical protein
MENELKYAMAKTAFCRKLFKILSHVIIHNNLTNLASPPKNGSWIHFVGSLKLGFAG